MSAAPLQLAFLVDPLATLKPAKDSSIAMMRQAAARGHGVHALQRDGLIWREGVVSAQATRLELSGDVRWYVEHECQRLPLTHFDALILRPWEANANRWRRDEA